MRKRPWAANYSLGLRAWGLGLMWPIGFGNEAVQFLFARNWSRRFLAVYLGKSSTKRDNEKCWVYCHLEYQNLGRHTTKH